MSDTKTILPLGGAAQEDNDLHRLDYIRRDQYDKQLSARISAGEIRAYGLVGGIGALLLLGMLALLRWASCLNVSVYEPTFGCTASTALFWVYMVALVGAAVATPALLIWGRVQRTRAEVYRARITRDRWSNPIDSLAVLTKQPHENWAELVLATQAEIAMAPYKQLPAGLDSLSMSQNNGATKATEAPALPDAGSPVKFLPPSEWLNLINDIDGEPHLLVAGKTKAGKSTLAELILALRIHRGDEVFIIDPHYQPVNKYGETTWCGLTGVGGDSWQSVKAALAGVRAEYERRKKAANQGTMPVGGFKPLTVIIDEVPEIYETLKDEWEAFQAVMGSGARKYNIFIVLITQSHLIKDIGGSTAKRENFVVIGLNEKARMLVLSEAYDATEKAAMLEALRGQQWSGAMVYRNEVHLLDRTGTKEMRPASLVGTPLWSVRPNTPAGGENPTCGRTDGRTDGEIAITDDDKLALLRAMRRDGKTRDQARETLSMMGVGFENGDWTRAGE